MPGLGTEDKSKAAKDNVYRIRGKATDWEELITGFSPKYIEPLKLNNKNIKTI